MPFLTTNPGDATAQLFNVLCLHLLQSCLVKSNMLENGSEAELTVTAFDEGYKLCKRNYCACKRRLSLKQKSVGVTNLVFTVWKQIKL